MAEIGKDDFMDDRLKQGERATAFSALVSLFLLILKAIAGLITGSIALITDALNSASDMLTMLMSWLGFRISRKKPDEKFNYGYYKAESLAAFFISLSIIYAAFIFIERGWNRVFYLSEIAVPIIGIIASATSVVVSFLLYKYLIEEGKKTGSQLLFVSAKDRLLDSFSSAIVLIAIFTAIYGINYIEGIATIIISLIIMRTGLLSLKESVLILMDASPSAENERKIENIIKKTGGVDSIKSLKLRKAGPFIMGDVTVRMKKYVSIEKAHEVADQIESNVKKKFSEMQSFIVHIEPYKGTENRIAVPVSESKGMDSKISESLGRASHFLFFETSGKKIKRTYSRRNIHKKKSVRAGLAVSHLIEKEKTDVVITSQIGEITFHTLRDHYIEIYRAKGKTAGKVVQSFLDNKLKPFKRPGQKKD